MQIVLILHLMKLTSLTTFTCTLVFLSIIHIGIPYRSQRSLCYDIDETENYLCI